MIKFLEYLRLGKNLLEGYIILSAQEVLKYFDQNAADRITLYMVEIRDSGNGEISLTQDLPQPAIMDAVDVDYYEETFLNLKEGEEKINICFLKAKEAENFIKQLQKQDIIFPKFVPQVLMVSPV